ncbi:MAG: aminotransferase class III-fold pyridoxal phosphate-dependent enzyme, partial [Candidatus Bathyarchaeota archaeon]
GGTFTANPVSTTAGLETLKILEDGKKIKELNKTGEKIRKKLRTIFETHNVNVQVTGAGSLFNIHFTKDKVKDSPTASKADKKRQLDYHQNLITNGIFFLPTHTGALSTSHSTKDIDKLFAKTEEYLTT